ncbi:hypothetical protein T4B_7276 [Trichinella pseudospiralis]|uniref:Uncharacterized protein n=1 Tax=Trichinella pseudospiralis TaxID=6337 RepID=A0A0V1GXV3_TRIPS|nr:hypothetical protein T4B_7276 [Trichinella pseudospiralis]
MSDCRATRYRRNRKRIPIRSVCTFGPASRRSEPFALLALAGNPHGGGDTMFDRFSLRHSPALPNHSSGSPGKWKHTAPFGLDLGPNDAPPPLTVFVLTQNC